ncbi:MAG: hypothetical protein F4X02_06465 [Chloroflexi bacterium]|nr:hypothetical protein [Chloroflexota bacterium]
MSEIDLTLARLHGKARFQPFAAPNHGEALANAGLDPDDALLLLERRSVVKTFLLKQMTYHHVAQGEICDEPYMISF